MWIAQFFAIMGFSFALPFVPFYLQQLGVTGQEEIRIWSGLFQAFGALAMVISAPFWGYVTDRIGKKPMVLRASLAGALVMLGMGLATSPGMLLFFRIMQGLFTGTITANLILVVSTTPKHRMGLGVGIVNSAVYIGNAVSPLIGGILADSYGYRISFLIGALLLFLSFLINLFFIREGTKPNPQKNKFSLFSDIKSTLAINAIIPIVLMALFYGFSYFMQKPIFPLYVQELVTPVGFFPRLLKLISGFTPEYGIATLTGVLTSITGVAAIASGFFIGILLDKGKSIKIGTSLALLGAIFIFPIAFVTHIWQLFPLFFIYTFLITAVDQCLKIGITRLVPKEKQGSAFGVYYSFRSFGWFLGPLCGGFIAAKINIPVVYIISSGLYIVLAGVFFVLFKKKTSE